jgi:hypothetical protein
MTNRRSCFENPMKNTDNPSDPVLINMVIKNLATPIGNRDTKTTGMTVPAITEKRIGATVFFK